jgi:exodeoxyribonuclease VII large subunit
VSAAPRPGPRVVGVRRVVDYLRRKLESDTNLRDIRVTGEISNYAVQPKNGHVNFVLKEGDAVLNAFAWADDAAAFPRIANGMAVIAAGSIATFAQRSTYQLLVRSLELYGVGQVHALFEELKKKLDAEGLFAPERKRPLPPYPFRVALVSSRTSDGATDFVTLLRKRAPHVAVVWCETSVQGANAPPEIAAAIGRASRADVDAIVVTRGGGSFEDLFAFSDERVVRAVATARHPVVSAIGHTVDLQLCDFAADRHVETPSAAAESLGADLRDIRRRLDERVERARRRAETLRANLQAQLERTLTRSRLAQPRVYFLERLQSVAEVESKLDDLTARAIRRRESTLREFVRRLDARDPSRRLAERARRLQAATLRLEPAARARLERGRQRLALAVAHLDGKNPEAILQRGYAIVTYADGIVRDSAAVPEGAVIEARLARGTLSARVERKETDGN